MVSPEQVLELIQQGEANRHIGATRMNEGSSRSHTVFRMVSVIAVVDCSAGAADAGQHVLSCHSPQCQSICPGASRLQAKGLEADIRTAAAIVAAGD